MTYDLLFLQFQIEWRVFSKSKVLKDRRMEGQTEGRTDIYTLYRIDGRFFYLQKKELKSLKILLNKF
jgi:hypothetical protein